VVGQDAGRVRSLPDHLRDLHGVVFDVGLQDAPHIITGARLFSAALARIGIEHQYQQYEGDHNHQLSERSPPGYCRAYRKNWILALIHLS
jgi:hypothetical protein